MTLQELPEIHYNIEKDPLRRLVIVRRNVKFAEGEEYEHEAEFSEAFLCQADLLPLTYSNVGEAFCHAMTEGKTREVALP